MDEIFFLISGSRKATPGMLRHARAVVRRCLDHQYTVVVGDNPEGIDRAVIEFCDKLGMDPAIFTVGETNRARLAIAKKRIPGNIGTKEDFHNRDQIMCDLADMGYFIWDNQSPGTKAAWDYFTQLPGKKGWLVQFEGEKHFTMPFESPARSNEQVQISLF